MLIWLQSKHCILCLVLNVYNQEKNTKVCIANFLSSNGRNSDNVHLKLSKHAYFEKRIHSMLSKYENSKKDFTTSSPLNSTAQYFTDSSNCKNSSEGIKLATNNILLFSLIRK